MKYTVNKKAFTMEEHDSGLVKTWKEEHKWLTDKETVEFCVRNFLESIGVYGCYVLNEGKCVLEKDLYEPSVGLYDASIKGFKSGGEDVIVLIGYLNLNEAYNTSYHATYNVFVSEGWKIA